ncbi:MAG TPA: hypothetical protein VNG93_11685 [Candidatus Dormibacteraeota bacterium]|nr:hypothetical protein [Candidatus Dormibacteraeota bacterium]
MAEGNFEIGRPTEAENLNMACFAITRALADLDFSVPEAAPLARHLLRIVGRIIIDTGVPAADPRVWANTESTALQWLREALKPIGYDVQPLAGSGRPPVADPLEGWTE